MRHALRFGPGRWGFVAVMSWVLAPDAAAADVPTSTLVAPAAAQKADQQIRNGLKKPMSAQWEEQALDKIVAEMGRQAGVKIELDEKSLDNIAISGNSPVTLRVPKIDVETVLELVLDRLDPAVTWTIRGDKAVILTREDERSQLQTRAYPVGDLVGAGADFESLASLIQMVIAPESWDVNGGAGTLKPAAGGVIRCQQSRSVHDRLADLLVQLREVRQPLKGALAAARKRAETPVRAALARRVTVDWKEARLEEALADLAKQLKIAVLTDRFSLEALNVGGDKPVTFKAKNMPAQQVLQKLLAPLANPDYSWQG